MSLRDRILKFIESRDLTVKSFESYVGLSNGAVSKMGDNTRRSTLEKISKVYPSINIDWLLTGAGEMEKPKPQIETPAQNKFILGGEDFSPATDSGDIRIDVGAPELAIKVGTLQTRLKDALDKIREKDQYIADLKNHIADLRDIIATLKAQIDSLKASRQ